MSSQLSLLVVLNIAVSHLLSGDPPDINNAQDVKKAKATEGEPEAMDTNNNPSPPKNGEAEKTKPTFKEMITASSLAERKISLHDQEEFNIDEEDVIINKESSILEVWFSEKVQNELIATIKQMLVVRLLSGDLGYTGLMTGIRAVLKPKGEYALWILRTVFSTKKILPARLAAWVHLPDLLVHYYNKSAIRYIGSLLGEVLRIEYNTSFNKRGQFAYMAIEIDMSKPLTGIIIINGKAQKVEYEGILIVCYQCGKVGHLK